MFIISYFQKREGFVLKLESVLRKTLEEVKEKKRSKLKVTLKFKEHPNQLMFTGKT